MPHFSTLCSVCILLVARVPTSVSFSVISSGKRGRDVSMKSTGTSNERSVPDVSRREWVKSVPALAGLIWTVPFSLSLTVASPAEASDFTPGGTLVDREVGVTVGNSEASLSRKFDNTNVLFNQDYFFKFGTAAPWLEPESTDFPKTMPFTRVQQRYDAIKKYQARVQEGLARVKALEGLSSKLSEVADPTSADVYFLRPMGLLANNMLASENSGSTNELFLARWYINEIYLLVNDMRNAQSPEQAKVFASAARKAANSYINMMNRVITSKVGDKFEYL